MHTHHRLPAELTIYGIVELRTQWLALVDEDESAGVLRMNGAAVNNVDAAGVQLLLALSRYLTSKSRSLQIVDASSPLSQACGVIGALGLLSPTATAESLS